MQKLNKIDNVLNIFKTHFIWQKIIPKYKNIAF